MNSPEGSETQKNEDVSRKNTRRINKIKKFQVETPETTEKVEEEPGKPKIEENMEKTEISEEKVEKIEKKEEEEIKYFKVTVISSKFLEKFQFQTKKIRFGPIEYKIVTQNLNGPCPLIALINVLVLKGIH